MVAADFLTCGSCQREFLLSNIVVFIEHKKANCDISQFSSQELSILDTSLERFLCSSCPEKFSAAVTLLQHAQQIHHIKIFQEEQQNLEDGGFVDDGAGEVEALKVSKTETETTSSETPRKSTSINKSSTRQKDKCQFQLEKCCSSVVPKKRKRHVETKHLKGRKPVKRKEFLGERGTIYIDLESAGESNDEDKPQDHPRSTNQSTSVILQPGSTYSIPVSYYSGAPSFAGMVIPLPTSTQDSTEEGQTSVSKDEPASENVEEKINVDAQENNLESSSELLNSAKKRRYPTSKPFKCSECDHSFNQRIHLKKHLSKHTGVKPYKCQQCDYSTVERSHLKVHIRIHTGEKPFKCTYCEYATAQNSTLKIHLKRHHSSYNEEISCSVCGVSFPQPELLNNHQREHQAPDEIGDLGTLAEVCVQNAEPMKIEEKETGMLKESGETSPTE